MLEGYCDNPNAVSEIEENKKESVICKSASTNSDTHNLKKKFNQRITRIKRYYTYNYQDPIKETKVMLFLNTYSKEQNFNFTLFNKGFEML